MEAVAHPGKHQEYKHVPIGLSQLNSPLDHWPVGAVALTVSAVPFW
jgi:hypothetical protein